MDYVATPLDQIADYFRTAWERDEAKYAGWVIKALLAVYQRQTADEQETLETRHDNGVGFNGPDAHRMSRYAEEVMAWKAGYDSQGANTFSASSRNERARHFAFERGQDAARNGYAINNQWPLGRDKTAEVKERIMKYAGQLAKIAKDRARARDTVAV